MNLNDLTPDQIRDILRAAQDLIDGDFYNEHSIQIQTGLPLVRCKEMVSELSVIRSLIL